MARLFQLHSLTDEALVVLEQSRYALDTYSVKAVSVSLDLTRKGDRNSPEQLAISIKFPLRTSVVSKHGLLVYVRESDKDAPTQNDLFDPVLAATRASGLYITKDDRILSLTPYKVRLCATGQLAASYAWGSYDRRSPYSDLEPPKADLDALSALGS